MLLTVDIGNTSITLGLFDEEALVEEFRLASDKDLSLEEYEILLKSLFKDFKVVDCIISSVVEELTEKFKTAVDNVFKIDSLVLTNKINTGIKIKLDAPDEAGADRIANAAGAYILYKHPVIVIDFGTATSFDIVNEDGDFIGGVIAPGINLQMKVLNQFTSKLPRTDVAISTKAIGSNTTDAILSGVIRGTASMIDGLVEHVAQKSRHAVFCSPLAADERHPIRAGILNAPLHKAVNEQILLFTGLHKIGLRRIHRQNSAIEVHDVLQRSRHLDIKAGFALDVDELSKREDQRILTLADGIHAQAHKAQSNGCCNDEGRYFLHLPNSSRAL